MQKLYLERIHLTAITQDYTIFGIKENQCNLCAEKEYEDILVNLILIHREKHTNAIFLITLDVRFEILTPSSPFISAPSSAAAIPLLIWHLLRIDGTARRGNRRWRGRH